ncbi:MAG: hypothetical protein O2871_03655 [bacterium]|nr:hypothetical protein [bacterium]
MKIYFIASLYGKEKYSENYKQIVQSLKGLGHKVISSHVLGKNIDDIRAQEDSDRTKYYKQMISWLNSADLVVAEVTSPSSSVGHELTVALKKEKPVIALAYNGVAPNIFYGIKEDKFELVEYGNLNPVEISRILEKALQKAQDSMDIRFNFFISPKMSRFLDWISKDRMIPKAVFLRRLIEQETDKAKDFPG